MVVHTAGGLFDGWGRVQEKGRKTFFFEKKNQKTFPLGARTSAGVACEARRGEAARRAREKFFGSFFQKRTSFFPS
jgi:hypothetical protein